MPKVLLADDDQQIRKLVTDWLEHQQFNVDTAGDGAECREYLLAGKYDAIILDWQMPELTGIEICRWFRGRGGTTPILLLTAKDEIEDKEGGFAAGVDDYLTKPFALRELSVRVNALLRRGDVAPSRIIQIGPLTIDPDAHSATVDGNALNLTATEFSVLEYMGRHPGQVFNANALLDRVWKSSAEVSPDTVRVYIRRLREKLQAVGYQDLLQNIHGVGYKLDASTDKSFKP